MRHKYSIVRCRTKQVLDYRFPTNYEEPLEKHIKLTLTHRFKSRNAHDISSILQGPSGVPNILDSSSRCAPIGARIPHGELPKFVLGNYFWGQLPPMYNMPRNVHTEKSRVHLTPTACTYVQEEENTLGIAHLRACQRRSYSGPIKLTPDISVQAVHCYGLHPGLDPRDQTVI